MPTTFDPAKTVLVDMDGVLANFDRSVLAGIAQHTDVVDRRNFYIAKDYPEHKEHVRAIMEHPEFFYTLEPIDGALEGWARLLDLGYTPRICSAPLQMNPKSREGKLAWLAQHFAPTFGNQVVDSAIIDKEKFAHAGVALIDDRPEVDTNNGAAAWKHIVFDHPYNRDSTAPLRLLGWRDTKLAGLLTTAAEQPPLQEGVT